MPPNTYSLGEPNYQSPHATVETKPSSIDHNGRRDSGGGYERIRSWEHDPTKPGDGKSNVYAYIHRLAAIAWNYPDDMSTGKILEHIGDRDVHHQSGVEWDNREDNLEVVDHGRHSEITQAQIRAWAEDSRQQAFEYDETDIPESRCVECGDEPEVECRLSSLDGPLCMECAGRLSNGESIEVV